MFQFLRRTPLAWYNLTHDPRRLLVAVGGVCFAVLLMFVQRGFQNALFDSQVKLIDDLNPENYQHIMERLFDLGARDVNLTPIHMKKNRPGIILSVLLEPHVRSTIEHVIYEETTTLGRALRKLKDLLDFALSCRV